MARSLSAGRVSSGSDLGAVGYELNGGTEEPVRVERETLPVSVRGFGGPDRFMAGGAAAETIRGISNLACPALVGLGAPLF